MKDRIRSHLRGRRAGKGVEERVMEQVNSGPTSVRGRRFILVRGGSRVSQGAVIES